MAIWRKKKQRAKEEKSVEENTSTRSQSPKSNSCLTHSLKELDDENEGKSKASEEEVSLKAPKILDLNEPYKEEENNGDVIVLPSKRNNKSCMIKTEEATVKIQKYQTYIPPKLIVKGCQACYIFVMIPETDQKCPKCRVGTYLFDVCNEFHANKKRLI